MNGLRPQMDDLIYGMLRYIDWTDKPNFIRAFPHVFGKTFDRYYAGLKVDHFGERYNAFLRSQGIDPAVLRRLCSEKGGMIVGSSILKVLTEADWDPNDIDVCLPYTKCRTDYMTELEPYDSYLSSVPWLSEIVQCYDSIQLIIMRDGYSPTMNVHKFDLDIVHLMYDFKNLYIQYPSAIVNRIGTGSRARLDRMQKYMGRGYSVNGVEAADVDEPLQYY